MKKFYVSKREGNSGIYKYSCDFYDLILKQQDYIFLDSATPLPVILQQVSVLDKVHIEIGIFLEEEKKILFKLIEEGYINITVTLHDAPLVQFPFFQFKNNFLNKISKFYDLFINRLQHQKKYLKKIACIYVLTEKGLQLTKAKYKLDNIHFLPHLVNKSEIKSDTQENRNFIYIGYIGKNKGIEYSLQLHQQLLHTFPDIKFYIAGKALGEQEDFYAELKKTYSKQTYFVGYVPEYELPALFNKAEYSLLLFKDYDFYVPFSGSILHSLKMGKIVFTNDVNATSELIKHAETGFFLSTNLEQDVAAVTKVLKDEELKKKIKQKVHNLLYSVYASEQVSKYMAGLKTCNN